MADVNITIKIPSAKVARAMKILQVKPIPKENPLVDPAMPNLYTPKQWIKILIIKHLKDLVKQAEHKEAVSEEDVAE